MPRKRILLADDEPHVRTFMKLILRKLEVDVVAEAGTGGQAVEAYRTHRPDLLLMDIMMPTTTGDEALAAIMTEFPEANVIMLTSMSDTDSVNRCLKMGAVDYLLKDGTVDDILKTIRRALWADGGGCDG